MEDKRYMLTPSEQAAWLARFDEAERVMGKSAADAIRRLYSFYGIDWLYWLAGLYDVESGCFYYSESARDNEGFLVDCESTAQTIGIINFSGAADRYGLDWKRVLPEDACRRMLSYVQSMQDKDDGYFYHKQWGKKIGDARRGRDYSQCNELIERMGGKPLYPTATERLSNVSRAEKISDGATVAPHLLSKEAMLSYLEKFDIRHASHALGHTLAAQASQIVAAGLDGFLCDYLDSLQYSDTGLWEVGANYASLSGVIKIGSLYHGLGRTIKYGYRIIDSAIEVILSNEDPKPINYVFNPIGALSTAVGSILKTNELAQKKGESVPYDITVVRKKIYEKFPQIVDKTIEKLSKFRKNDGSFSYFQKNSLSYSQGVLTSRGVNEGDVNGLACAMQYILGSVFSFLGISRIPMCNSAHFEKFLDMIRDAKPIKKIPYPPDYAEVQDFEGGCMSHRFFGSTGGFGITPDPKNINGTTLRWTSKQGDFDAVRYNATDFLRMPSPVRISAFTLNADLLLLECAEDGRIFDIEVRAGDLTVVSIPVISDSGELFLSPSDTSVIPLGRVGDWLHIQLEYRPCGTDAAETKIFVLGKCVAVSESFVEKTALDFANGTALVSAEPSLSLLIDNLKCRIIADKS